MDLNALDKKKAVKLFLVSLFAFLLAYSIDQYYIYKKELFFLSKPVQFINSLFR